MLRNYNGVIINHLRGNCVRNYIIFIMFIFLSINIYPKEFTSELEKIRVMSETSVYIRSLRDSLIKTMIAHDSFKVENDVKIDLKRLFKYGSASYSQVKDYLLSLGWTKESIDSLFSDCEHCLSREEEISVQKFIFAIDVYVRDFNENLRGKRPGFESGEYYQEYTKFKLYRDSKVDETFHAALNSNKPDAKACINRVKKSYSGSYTSAELSIPSNWNKEMRRMLYDCLNP